jgi:subtilisin family serine protease
MCAKHNGHGTRGALKDCSVMASAGSHLLEEVSPVESGGITGFRTQISEYVATIFDFLRANPTIRTINLSLGYNWMPNFAVDPRIEDQNEIRDIVREQGRIFFSILAYAKTLGGGFALAAGNDSETLETPLPAEWTSPFNFGSMMVEQIDGWSNGLVVEAHGPDGKRAAFSNGQGQISCPGVDILSTLASPANGYGKLSGTSMAAPYCAAALATMRALRHELSLRDVIACLRASPDRIGSTPKLNIRWSVETCKR